MHVSGARHCDRTHCARAHRAFARRSFFVHPATRSGTRSGVALLLFVMLVFAFMGIAALTIDMGIASLTQAEMQNAADTASLEGVRLRDFGPYRAASNKARRPRVTELVQLVFDDDLHPTRGVTGIPGNVNIGGLPDMPPDGPDERGVSVGPIWSLTGGTGDGNVGATLVPTAPHADELDDPKLQKNIDDDKSGDMLSGEYSIYSNHIEHGVYDRDDYVPSGPEGPGWKSLAFLVRMRRTNEPSDDAPGVSSGGPTLPFVFGLGSMIRPHASDGSSYNPRVDGLTVRAVAIAAARPAMTVGAAPPAADRIGESMLGIGFWWPQQPETPQFFMLPLALSEQFWFTIPLQYGTPPPTKLIRTGSVVALESEPDVVVGTFIDPARGKSIGEAVTAETFPDSIPPALFAASYTCYFPIYAPIVDSSGTSTNRVIGYGYGVIHATDSTHWDLRKGFQNKDDEPIDTLPACAVRVAPDNASAHLTKLAPVLTKNEWAQIFDAHSRFAYPDFASTDPPQISFDWQKVRPGTVMAPVLVR
jgi:hypothetical protein